MRKYFIPFILLIINVCVNAQTKSSLFPGNLNVQPFTANFLEPRTGFQFQLNNNELRLDIGNSMDVVHFIYQNGSSISLGADLFTYTFLRGEKDFHFPVDAVDYLFGLNASYSKKQNDDEYGIRFRISHISAHFVDGHFDGTANQWREGRNPQVYSREFFEFIPYYSYKGFRTYAGYTYLFHVDPEYLGKNIYQIGFDYYIKNLFNPYITPFAGYDMRLTKIGKYSANNSIQAGIKFGHPHGRGFSVFYTYYSGKSIHGEYFDVNKNYSAIGINLDL